MTPAIRAPTAARALAVSSDPENCQQISRLLDDLDVAVREAVREAFQASVR